METIKRRTLAVPNWAFEADFGAAAGRSGIPAAAAVVADAYGPLAACAHGAARAGDIFAIASMTKAVTSVAAMQLVEKGLLAIDEPVQRFLPELAELPVLKSFDADGASSFGEQRHQVTLRQLLTHTAGFSYPWNHPLALRFEKQGGAIPFLVHEPGTQWHYGTNTDWVGRLVETVSGQNLEAYFQRHICGPLEMADTSFGVPGEKLDRLVTTHQRDTHGVLHDTPRAALLPVPAVCNGGGGLYSTAGDYVRFLQMILREGISRNGQRILRADTVHQMVSNQVGELAAGRIRTVMPERARDFEPRAGDGFGFGFLINRERYRGGRAAGSLAWAGIRNTYYWVDRQNGIAAVLLMQFLPFCDDAALAMYRDFESSVYAALP